MSKEEGSLGSEEMRYAGLKGIWMGHQNLHSSSPRCRGPPYQDFVIYKLIFAGMYNLEEILISLHLATTPHLAPFFLPYHIYDHLTCYQIHLSSDLLVA